MNKVSIFSLNLIYRNQMKVSMNAKRWGEEEGV